MSTNLSAIHYKSSDGTENTIKFHALVQEDHGVTSEVTKFSVQAGYEISNHAIKKNRLISLDGSFTDTIMAGTGQLSYNSVSNTKEMFKVLEALVRSSTVCRVVTNLGTYNPVVFTSFKTKQGQGFMDSMEFSISGEEVQVASTLSKSAPKRLSFRTITLPEELEKIKAEMAEAKLFYSDQAIVKQANVTLGEDFFLDSRDSAGKLYRSTYLCKANDPTDASYKYEVQKEATNLFGVAEAAEDVKSQLGFSAGLLGASSCMFDNTLNLAEDAIKGLVKTGLGSLEDALYGMKEDMLSFAGDGLGRTMLGMALECAHIQVEKQVFKDYNETDGTPAIDRDLRRLESKGFEALSEADTGIRSFAKSRGIITTMESPFKGALANLGVLF